MAAAVTTTTKTHPPIMLQLTADSQKTWLHRDDPHKYTNMVSPKQFLEYCFSWLPNPKIAIDKYSATSRPTIVVAGIRETDIDVPNNTLGLLLCCEDLRRSDASPQSWGYTHFVKYGDMGNNKIQVYFYNHHPKIIQTPKCIIIPFVYLYISYFKRKQYTLLPRAVQPPQYRKFCIITTARHRPLQEWIKRLGKCDHISQFRDRIGGDSCYHSQKLIDLLSEYKFVLCGENAYHAGYMTEKVFNAMFARTIPIYCGPPDTKRYLNPNAMLLVPARPTRLILTQLTRRIMALSSTPSEYMTMLKRQPINPSFHNENYEQRLQQFIQPWLINAENQFQAETAKQQLIEKQEEKTEEVEKEEQKQEMLRTPVSEEPEPQFQTDSEPESEQDPELEHELEHEPDHRPEPEEHQEDSAAESYDADLDDEEAPSPEVDVVAGASL